MPDARPLTQRQIARMAKLANAHERPSAREDSPRVRRGGRQASRRRDPKRTPRIQMVQSYLQVHD